MVIRGGVLNCALTKNDVDNKHAPLKYRSCELLNRFIENCKLCDIWRLRNLHLEQYTWRSLNPLRQRQLDYFFISSFVQPYVTNIDIIPAISTDHPAIKLCIDSYYEQQVFFGFQVFGVSTVHY